LLEQTIERRMMESVTADTEPASGLIRPVV
jgi:hypothetical protein